MGSAVWAPLAMLARGLHIPMTVGLAKLALARAEVLAALRDGLGSPTLPKDGVLADEIPSTAILGCSDRKLAEIDQDGFLFAEHPLDRTLFKGRHRRLRRIRYGVDVVLHDGTVCVRKRFLKQAFRRNAREWVWDRLDLHFYTEAAALLRLRESGCAPGLREIDLDSRTIYIDFIHGTTLRHQLAATGAQVLDSDLQASPELSRLTQAEAADRERKLFREAFGDRYARPVWDTVAALNDRGVAPLDVKPGNVIVGARTGALYWIDFETAVFDADPRWREQLRRQEEMVLEWFGERSIDAAA